jgi:hypothetical protein
MDGMGDTLCYRTVILVSYSRTLLLSFLDELAKFADPLTNVPCPHIR